jgi:hypothetical protein
MLPTPPPKNAGPVESAVDTIADYPGRGLDETALAIPGGDVSSEPGRGTAAVQPRRRHCGVMWTPDSDRWFPPDHRTSRRPGSGGQRRPVLPVWGASDRHRRPIRSWWAGCILARDRADPFVEGRAVPGSIEPRPSWTVLQGRCARQTMGPVLIMAGGGDGTPPDYDQLERWTRVGYERGMRSIKGER